MSRTMLKNYKMGLISYDELLKATANVFTWNKWDKSTLQNIEEVVDYLGKDLVDYMVQHKDEYKNAVYICAVSSCNLQALIAKLTEQVGSYEFKLTPAGYKTITVIYEPVSSEWYISNKFGNHLVNDTPKWAVTTKILALKEACQSLVIVTVRTKEGYAYFLCY